MHTLTDNQVIKMSKDIIENLRQELHNIRRELNDKIDQSRKECKDNTNLMLSQQIETNKILTDMQVKSASEKGYVMGMVAGGKIGASLMITFFISAIVLIIDMLTGKIGIWKNLPW